MSYRDQADLSKAQRDVLYDAGPRTLVAAGAGSGKTSLLVAYFVHSLLDAGTPLTDLAAVTFTRKAGSELVDRIHKQLVETGRSNLAREVDGAVVGTIHGLCRRLIAEQALAAGVDPSFGILEEDANVLAKLDVMRRAWARLVEEAGEDRLRVLTAGSKTLPDLALSLYDRLRTMGGELPHLRIDAEFSEAQARAALVSACGDALAAGREVVKRTATLDKELAKIVSCLEWLDQTATGAGTERTVEEAEKLFPSRGGPDAVKPAFERVRVALAQYRCALAETALRPVLEAVNALLELFHEEFVAYKEARGVLDFADLELRARAVLERAAIDAGGAPPTVFARVLVDEFQDTNELQCAIIDGLGAERLLMVGDARQSIYGFRGADVEVFVQREKAPGIIHHALDTNYRSRSQILDFVNHLFSQDSFFGADGFKPLLSGRDLGEEPDRKAKDIVFLTEVLVAERTCDGPDGPRKVDIQVAEAHAAAGRIRRLVDEEGWARSDIVLLLPALSSVTVYERALLARDLDPYVVGGKGYYVQDEVADLVALLKVLVNPHDNVSLLTVLRSPMVGVSDDCLYLLGRARRRRRGVSLWNTVREGDHARVAVADRERLEAFTERVAELRCRVGRPGLSRLVDDAASACDYDLCLLSAPEGRRRYANLRKLMRMAADYEDLEGPDLAGFVDLVGSLRDLGDDEGNAASLAEGEEVIRIMSIHKAKGLEFPVVVVAGLGSDAPLERSKTIVVGSDGRVGGFYLASKNDTYETDYPHWGPAPAIMAGIKERKAAEDLRLLYVAMTRARDRLILVGACERDKESGAKRIGRIVTALGLEVPPAPGETLCLSDIHAAVIGVAPPAPDTAADDADDPGDAATVSESCEDPPCFLELPRPAVIPQQVSFSALAAYERCPRRFYLERVLGLRAAFGAGPADSVPALGAARADSDGDPGCDSPSPPRALVDEAEAGGGIEVGLLVHTLLQKADLGSPRPALDDLRVQARAIAADQGLSLSPAASQRAIDLALAFWDSPLAADPEIASAAHETPFSFVSEGFAVNGIMDVLFQGEHRWRVVDYKSNALRGGAAAEAAADYRSQAEVYCLAALRAGAPAVRMEFLFLEKPGDPFPVEFSAADADALERRLAETLGRLRDAGFPPQTGPRCQECSVDDLCLAMNSGRPVVE
jgi:ATP-dependent helicase/nuclease subunit A